MSNLNPFPLAGSYPTSEICSALTSLNTYTPGQTSIASDDDEGCGVTDITPRRSNSVELSSFSTATDESQLSQRRAARPEISQKCTDAPRHRIQLAGAPSVARDGVTVKVPTFSPLHVRVVSPLTTVSTGVFDMAEEADDVSPPSSPHLRFVLHSPTEGSGDAVHGGVPEVCASAPIVVTQPPSPFIPMAAATPVDAGRLGATWSAVSVCAGGPATAVRACSPHSLSGSAATFIDHDADDDRAGNNTCGCRDAGVGGGGGAFDEMSRLGSGTFMLGSNRSLVLKDNTPAAGSRVVRGGTPSTGAPFCRPPVSPCTMQTKQRGHPTRLAPHYTREYAIAVSEAAKYRWTLKEILAARAHDDDYDDDEDEGDDEDEDVDALTEERNVQHA